jgi:hypothetical protein
MSQTAIKKRIAPSVPLDLEIEGADGSIISYKWKVRINYNVLADAQEVSKHNFMGGNGILDWVDDPSRIRALLWAALLPEQPELREEMLTIGEYLDGSNRSQVLEALFNAFSLYLHKDKRPEFDKASAAILSVVRTGKLPKEMEAASSPLAEEKKELSQSPGKSSEPSPASASELSMTTSSAA